MYGKLMQVLTQVVLLPLVSMLVKFFEKKLEQHFENEKLKKENEEKNKKFQDSKDEGVKESFEKLP